MVRSLRRGGPRVDLGAFLADWNRQAEAGGFRVERTPLAELDAWSFDTGTGNLVHDSGRFFSVEGLRVRTDSDYFPEWNQPIISQPEIGILGILVKHFDGVPYCLMQAKMEPGNLNELQLSPTVQATKSNYSRVHKGAPTKYLEYFAGPGRGAVVADVLQSEQGAWFYHKRNRNMIVEVFDDVEVHPGFTWLRLDQIAELMRIDNFVNMDSRTVLSCMPYSGTPSTPFGRALARSLAAESRSADAVIQLLSWFTEVKARRDVSAALVPLRKIDRWIFDDLAIRHESGKYFEIVGVSVAAGTREVTTWSQPLIAPCANGIVAFFARVVDGTAELLVQARVEAGCLDIVELGPTIQCTAENYADVPAQHRPAFLDRLDSLPPERIRFDSMQSEEGGRFYHAQNRYLIVEDDPGDVPPGYRWIPLGRLAELLRHSNYVNVQARSLIAALRSLCW